MNKLLSIDPAVMRRLRQLPKNEKVECLLALCDLVDGFGQPHVHSGLGIRKLANKLFECRGNRDLRFVFQDRGDELFVPFLGNHDEIKALLRRETYR
ncbi:MAG: hypothetical protein Q8S00_07630 [Deltaproteobacteria bacterium]|nr:hypothetical protein [Deltaproteobacteria bacterium]MDZ4347544.1 hypothetical protein [Candidatus Binatia bacterium]